MNTPISTERSEAAVTKLLQLLKRHDVAALKSFVEQWPPTAMKPIAVSIIRPYAQPDTIMTIWNSAVENYSRGIDPQLGITVSKAMYLYSQELSDASAATTHLSTAARAAINCMIGMNALGRHTELVAFAEAAERWFEEKRHLDVKPELLLHRIDALVHLSRFEEAETLLLQTNWDFLLKDRPGDQMWQARLASKVRKSLQGATELQSSKPVQSDREILIEQRRNMLANFAKMAAIVDDPEIASSMTQFVDSITPEELEKDLPDSLAASVLRNKKQMDRLTDLLSGKSATDDLRDSSKESEKELPDPLAESVMKNQERLDRSTDLLSGKPATDFLPDSSKGREKDLPDSLNESAMKNRKRLADLFNVKLDTDLFLRDDSNTLAPTEFFERPVRASLLWDKFDLNDIASTVKPVKKTTKKTTKTTASRKITKITPQRKRR